MLTVAVDFDGVIHAYSRGWADGSIYDEPLPGALDGLRTLMQHAAVFIHTTREAEPVAGWLRAHDIRAHTEREMAAGGEPVGTFWNRQDIVLVTNRKLPAVAYLDDRAVRFTTWGQALAELLPDESTPLGRLKTAAAKANAGAPPLAMQRLRDICQYVMHSDDDGIRTRETILRIIDGTPTVGEQPHA